MKQLSRKFFENDTVGVARRLLGKVIEYKGMSGMIVETEAYKDDEASHAFRRTSRSEIMYSSYGRFYVYFVYGNHFCLNITTEKNKPGAVLIRALQPLDGIGIMKKRRGTNDVNNLTNGPGKVCQALGITKKLNDTAVNDRIKVYDSGKKGLKIGVSERIGIKRARGLKWRFFVEGNWVVSIR